MIKIHNFSIFLSVQAAAYQAIPAATALPVITIISLATNIATNQTAIRFEQTEEKILRLALSILKTNTLEIDYHEQEDLSI